ncbi:MAG TPA: family 20 glycosylhydrolase, partial [Phycisphaerales bacterium]|nr:family 20 glycosylhydrolase [Phycisphaerales bacterium]
RALVGLLAGLKLNHLQLYTEHAFAYAGHEEVWRHASPLTPDEVRELDALCRGHGVTLAANQNCFGHMERWLRHPRYAPRAETHGEWSFSFDGRPFHRRGPFSLCPTDPQSLALVTDLLGQLLPCFSAPLVNIGCDETFDVGQGRSAPEVARRGRAAVYADFVSRVAEVARALGKRPMMWADIALSEPAALELIPSDVLGLAWGYEPDADFAAWCERLRARGREAWVAPGTSAWRSITGRTSERNANLRAAAEQGRSAGATGYLITEWGDNGHHQQWPVTLTGLAAGAEAAWGGTLAGGAAVAEAASLHVLGDPGLGLGPWLDELGDADLVVRRAGSVRNASALFLDLYRPDGRGVGVDSVEAWEDVRSRLEDLGRSRSAYVPANAFGGAAIDHARAGLGFTLDLARLASDHAVMARTGALGRGGGEVVARLDELVSRFAELWARESRPGGLEDSMAVFAGIRARLEREGAQAGR